ncbi:hypothetical protein MNEG_16260, partial [Monoraphidium neglectum]
GAPPQLGGAAASLQQQQQQQQQQHQHQQQHLQRSLSPLGHRHRAAPPDAGATASRGSDATPAGTTAAAATAAACAAGRQTDFGAAMPREAW